MTKPSANMTLTPFTPEMEAALIDKENEREALDGNQEDVTDSGDDNADRGQDEPREREQEEPADKPKPVPMSPQDAKRLAMADRFKRPDERPFDGDMTKNENMYGDVGAEALTPDPEAPEPGVPEGQQLQDEPKHEITVRGKKMLLTTAELLERAQKVEAADTYLAESRDLLEQAKQVRSGRAAADPQHPEGDNRTQEDGQDGDDRQTEARHPGIDLKAVVEKIQFGDPEEAAAELAKAISATARKETDEGHVQRLVRNDLAKSQTELRTFREANPDLDKDPIASNAIENMIYRIYRDEIVKLGVDEAQIPKDPKDLADWHRLYRVHGYEVSKTADILTKAKASFEQWRGAPPKDDPKPAPRKEAARVQVNVDRTERRMQIPVQPSRGVAPRRNPEAPQTQDQGRKSAVQEMRKARGQPVH